MGTTLGCCPEHIWRRYSQSLLFKYRLCCIYWGGGAPVTLGLDGWYREGSATAPAGDYTGYISAPSGLSDITYWRLAYDPETKQACAYNATYIPDLLSQELANNQVLVRLTFDLPKANYQKISGGSYPQLFAGTTYGSGYFCIWTNGTTAGTNWDLRFEFSAAKEVKVHSLTMNISTQSGAQISATSNAALYLDDQELPLIGGLTGSVYGEANTRTIQRIDPLALLYKSAGGGLYQINPSDFVKRSELQTLLDRVTALEEKTDGDS